MTRTSNLISVEELRSQLGDPATVVLDCRSELKDTSAGRRMYRRGHIPSAAYADLDDDLSAPVSRHSGRHPLPDAARLAETLGQLGIDNRSRVIVYDDRSGALAARAWWLLRWLGHDRVQLLDGGIARWMAASMSLATGTETAEPRRFVPKPRSDQVLTTAELFDRVCDGQPFRLFDARDAARFRGEVEPIDAVAGHIPGASNVPFGLSLNDDGTWKPVEALDRLWTGILGHDRRVPWAVMCGSGVTACHLAVSAAEAGFREPKLYAGSWSEWIRDPSRPVALGEA